ncbi:hypothetical protein niasHT_035510 [Heterodera trifolii]|uniref:DUF8206 domain-containing protein n=1 Tax=Heterodera trifolii TaxID=157864 RepID=A0ABD2IVG2_9BILA
MMPTFLNATDGVNPTDQVPLPFDGSPNSPTPSESGFELVEEEGKQKQQQMDGEADNQQKMDKIIPSVENLRVANGEEAQQQMAELEQKVVGDQKNAQPMDTFCASVTNRMELAKKLESKGVLYVRHHQQLKNALCGQKKNGKNGPTENFVLFCNKPNSTPDTLKQFFLALHYLFKLAEAQKNCLFVDLELFSDGHKKTKIPKVISNSLDVFPLIGARLIRLCGDQLVTDDWVAKKTQALGMCTARTSDPKKISSPVDKLLWPCHLPCPCAEKFGGKCPNGDHFWGCEQCGQTFKFAKQKNDDMGQKGLISHLFCDCGGTRVDRLTFFRCAFFADHGVHFHMFTTLDLLNIELERQSIKDIVKNLLLLGKTGNGKSTLLNAMHLYAQFETFEDALKLAQPANFDGLAAALYSKETYDENGDSVPIEVGLGGAGECREAGESQTQISKSYFIPPTEDEQFCCVIDTAGNGDTRGTEMDNQNMANTFGFLRGYDALHGVGIVLKENDNRADASFNYCINGLLSNLHKNVAQNIVFLITHSSGSGKTIALLRRLLKPIEEKTDVKIPLNESNVFSFDNAPFEALCLIKAKDVQYDEEEMEEFSRKWTKSVREFKRLLKHLATVKPHLTRETLSVYAARCAIADIMPIIASNGEQIQNNIVNMEIDETKKIIGEDEKKAEIKFDRVTYKSLGRRRVVCTSKRCTETAKTLGAEVKLHKKVCHDGCDTTGGEMPNGKLRWCKAFRKRDRSRRHFLFWSWIVDGEPGENCKNCGCSYKEHMVVETEQVVEKNVVADTALLERISEKRKELSTKEAFKQQLIEERDFCFKEPAKWFSFLKSSAMKAYNDNMERYIELAIQDAELREASNNGQSDYEEQKKRTDGTRKLLEFYRKERDMFTEGLDKASVNVEEFKFPTENVEQIFDGLFALEITGKQMKANYETTKEAQREHQKQSNAEAMHAQNLVKAKPTKCQSASNQKAIQCYLDEMTEKGQQQLGEGWKAGENAEPSPNVGMTDGGESEGEKKVFS